MTRVNYLLKIIIIFKVNNLMHAGVQSPAEYCFCIIARQMLKASMMGQLNRISYMHKFYSPYIYI